jgi:Secretion system C-terminal sorting domain
MKKALLLLLLLSGYGLSFGQAYISIPADSARWRYRILVNDDLMSVSDLILYVNGQDTVISGNSYHKIFSRSNMQTDTIGANPPVVSVVANTPDVFFGGIREAGKYVYFVTAGPEQMIFNFNAVVGDAIPGSLSTVHVTAIDSVLIGARYHKRYKTTDTTYYVVEGVGSNRGLIPDFVDGTGIVTFHCFTREPDTTWSPDTTLPCTEVYPIGYGASVRSVTSHYSIDAFPNPASGEVHLTSTAQEPLSVKVFNSVGQRFWSGYIVNSENINVAHWPRGLYFVSCSGRSGTITKQLIIE